MVFWSHLQLSLEQDICDHSVSKRHASRVMNVMNDLDTPRITGTSPGSRIQYETPVNVVPTSNASTSFRVKPVYGFRESIVVI